MAMRGSVFLFVLFVLGAAEILHAEEILDAKLNALKKKAQRRNYSATAILNDRNLVVPKAVTDEEKELDAKIRAMEKELDTTPAMMSRQAPRPRRVRQPDQDASANWLTPALLNQLSGKNDVPDEEETSWVTAELARQQSLRQEKLTQAEEKKLVEQRVQEKMRRNTTPSFAPENDYRNSLQSIISGGSPAAKAQEEIPKARRFPLNRSAPRSPASSRQTLSESSSSRFLYSESQSADAESRDSSSFLKRQKLNLDFNRRPLSPFSRQPSEEKAEEPIRKRIRPASRSREENPFEKKWVPDMKKSIWD